MTSTTDPTLEIAERQLVLLAELTQIAMAAARAFGASAVASAAAEERILADEYFMPEVGRARACGAKDAAESLQKVSRAVRLTLKLEMAVAEIVRDLRAGVVPVGRDETASTPGCPTRRIVFGALPDVAARAPDTDDEGRPACEECFGDRERAEFERPEVLPRGSYSALVDRLAADVGAVIDWDAFTVTAPADRSECRTSHSPRSAGVPPAFSDRQDAGGTPGLRRRGELTPATDPPATVGVQCSALLPRNQTN